MKHAVLVCSAMAIAALSSSTTPVQAGMYGFCSEPSEPSCLSFGDVDSYCKSNVESYLRQLREHADCVAKEDADKASKAVDKWNCRIKGHDFCP